MLFIFLVYFIKFYLDMFVFMICYFFQQQLREAQNYSLQQHTYVGINNNETGIMICFIFLYL